MDKTSFQKTLTARQHGQSVPALSLVRSVGVDTAALIAKAIAPPIDRSGFEINGKRRMDLADAAAFRNISDRISQSSEDAETVMQLLPDLEMAANILISSILSPKDMMKTELLHQVTEGVFPPGIAQAMLVKARLFFEQVHKIEPMLPSILYDALFRTGSYGLAVIPENAIDQVINGELGNISQESFPTLFSNDGKLRSIGILGPVQRAMPRATVPGAAISMEMFGSNEASKNTDGLVEFSLDADLRGKIQTGETFLNVTDNPDVLKIPLIGQKIREDKIKRSIGLLGATAMESATTASKMSDRDLIGRLYKTGGGGYTPLRIVPTQAQTTRKTIGHPLIMHIPSEATIPVFVPGSPDKQVGFFVLLDQEGHPIARYNDPNHYAELSQRMNSNSNFASAMLNKVKSQMNGIADWQFDSRNNEHLNMIGRVYGNVVEQELLARLRNGVHGSSVQVAQNDQIYRVMLARSLARQHTQLLFLPAELLTYFAFNYNKDGTGRSLMDDMRIINSLRAMLMFSDTMSAIRNSIPRTDVKFKLDEDDPDPRKSLEQMIDSVVKTRTSIFPVGVGNPADIIDHLQRAGFQFSVEGHPGFPDIQATFSEVSSNYVKPDSTLSENLRRQSILRTGVNPQNVDANLDVEFATSIVTNNLLLAKRVMTLQNQFTPMLSSHARSAMQNSAILVDDLRQILIDRFDELELEMTDEAKKLATDQTSESKHRMSKAKEAAVEAVLVEFFKNYNMTLPAPDNTSVANQLTSLKAYIEALDEALNAYINPDFLTQDLIGDAANQVAAIRSAIRSHYIRAWMAENGMMSELSKITAVSDDKEPMTDFFESQLGHVEGLVKSFASFAIQIGKTKDKMNAKLEKANGGSDDATASAGDGGEVDLTNPTSGDIPGLDDGVETSGTEPVQAGDAADIPTTGEQENSSANTDDDTVIPPAV